MFSLTSEYALRALVYLAQHSDAWPIPGKEIAEQAGIPPRYLSTILSDLVRVGVLESARGKTGGFRMVRSPRETRLLDVVSPFEQFEQRRCPFGNQQCSDEDPCLAHEKWKRVLASLQDFLRKNSVHDVALRKRDRRGAPGQGSARR